MRYGLRGRRRRRCVSGVAFLLGALALVGPVASAKAEPPQIVSSSVESVTATTATLRGSVNPEGIGTTYRYEYLTLAAYETNLTAGRDPFTGAARVPAGGSGLVGSGSVPTRLAAQQVKGLAAETSYEYRLRAENTLAEVVEGHPHPFATQPPTNAFELLDHRGWEMVSPIVKGGGAVQPPGSISGGGVFQAAAAGGAFTFSSADSFGEGAQGAPSGSQYLSVRATGGWSTANITTPLLSGSYGSEPDGVPYQLFSGDLGHGLLSNGERCRGIAGGDCAVANPPLPGSGAPASYRDYYRRTPSGTYESLLTAADLLHTSLGPEEFELRLVAAGPDLAYVVVSSCAALAPGATEVTAPGGCDQADQNLYEWSGGNLSLVNAPPGGVIGSLPAVLAGPSGAFSDDGSRVYFTSGETVYLREAGVTKTVLGGPGVRFATASATDGSTAYLINAGNLDRYSAATGTLTPLTTGGGVEGVLGVSADGSEVYYAEGGAVFLRSGSTVTEVAASALPGNWLPGQRTARVTRDGSHLLFLSDAELTGYPSEGQTEVFLYEAPAARLTCVSCDPSGELPRGGASIPGVRRNGGGTEATAIYLPRDLSADGERAFFETPDPLVAQDTDGAVDVYEWEADGEGTCARVGGCVQLISGGRGPGPSYFLDADESGSEAFFLTAASLYPPDPGSYDVYDAREGGGFPVPESPIPCVADACQVLPEAPEDPSPGTLTPNSGNPTLKVTGTPGGKGGPKKKHHKKHHHKKKAKKSADDKKKHAGGKGAKR